MEDLHEAHGMRIRCCAKWEKAELGVKACKPAESPSGFEALLKVPCLATLAHFSI